MWLPSGGSLVIDRTEAMTVVDVNTGKFVGSGGNLEETVTKNIIEAAEEEREFRLSTAGDFDSLSQDDLMRIETTDVRAAISGVLSGLMR